MFRNYNFDLLNDEDENKEFYLFIETINFIIFAVITAIILFFFQTKTVLTIIFLFLYVYFITNSIFYATFFSIFYTALFTSQIIQ